MREVLKQFWKRGSVFLAGWLILGVITANGQEKKEYKVSCIAFYNLENLFDINDDENVDDTEYTPEGDKNWDQAKYDKKLESMAEVISKIGIDVTHDGVAVLGVSEIENKGVLEDLVKEESIKGRDYHIVHYDSPDKRGVDVGFLYQPRYFEVTNSKAYRLRIDSIEDFLTRDQLLVSGIFDGEPMHFIINHWPSRRGGEKGSAPRRNAAAKLCRSIVDSILALDANAKIIVMGDLNDDPTNESVKKYLKAVGSVEKMTNKTMFNPMEKLNKNGIGSLAYRDNWNLFDQLIITPGLLGTDKSTYKYYQAHIFNKNFLTQASGQYKGYPLRTHAGGQYLAGYSDHFPAYLFLIKEFK